MGCGLSRAVPGSVTRHHDTLVGHADDLIELARSFAAGDLVCVSHSVGTMIALLAEARAPDLFAAHVMITPSPCYLNDGAYHGGFSAEQIESLLDLLDGDAQDWSRVLAELVIGLPADAPATREIAQAFCAMKPANARRFARATFLSDLRQEVHTLDKPALLVQSRVDPVAPQEVGLFMAAAMPRSRLLTVENAGHCPHITAPEPTAEAINEMLRAFTGEPGAVRLPQAC
jgi:sigma-B regulation protein RsbQ